MRPTQKALIARGLDSEKAEELAKNGWTLTKLKSTNSADLEKAGLDNEFIEKLFKEARPPIPDDALMSVLFANRYQCCVCRDPKLPFIVHHIEEWAVSRSHDIQNLSVLCLHHHDEAHSRKTLSKNLDAKTLRGAKAKWEAEVKQFDTESILEAMRLDYSNWNYMNELRIFEIAKAQGIKFSEIRGFHQLVEEGIVEIDGLPIPVDSENLLYKYQGSNIQKRYFYVSNIFAIVIQNLPIINVSNFLDKGSLKFAIAPGDFIFVQGKHVFSPIVNRSRYQGHGQIYQGVRRANNVEVQFVFDRWEATSSSAQSQWLTGTRNQGSLVQVKDISREDCRLMIRGTVLGICSNFGDLKTREYAKSWLEWTPNHPEEDEIDEDWQGEQ